MLYWLVKQIIQSKVVVTQFLYHPLAAKVSRLSLKCLAHSIVGSLRDREVACSASDRQGLNFESCVWRTVSSQSSHHPQKVLLAQFSLYVHKGGLKPDSFHFILPSTRDTLGDDMVLIRAYYYYCFLRSVLFFVFNQIFTVYLFCI